MLRNPEIKVNGKGTETDRFWKVAYNYVVNVEITVHLYITPKNKKGSKLLVQGGVQAAICTYVFEEPPYIYTKVCEHQPNAIEDKSDIGTGRKKSLVKCAECNFQSSLIQMKGHIKKAHTKKPTRKRPSLTPLPNPPKRVPSMPPNPSVFALLNSEEPMSVSLLNSTVETGESNLDEVVLDDSISPRIIPSVEPENKKVSDIH